MTFHCTVRRSDGLVCVELAGELDFTVTEQVAAAITEALAGGTRRIEVDVSAVTLIDSSSVGLLMTARSLAQAARCRLVLTGPRPLVLRVLQILGVLDTLTDGPAPRPRPG